MRRPALAWFAAAILCARLAAGQDPRPSLDLRGFRASTDARSGIALEPASSPATGAFDVGLWTSYAFRPLTLVDPSGKGTFRIVEHQLTSDFTASVGFAERVTLGLDLPVLLYQEGDRPTEASRRALGDVLVPSQALGDLGLVVKFTLVPPNAAGRGFALALHERFTLPTGDPSSFLGEGGVTTETRLLGEYALPFVTLHAAFGAKLRTAEESFACEAVADPEACSTRFGHELPFGLGVAFKPKVLGIDAKDRVTLFVETHGYVPLSPIAPFESTAASEAQVGFGARYRLRDFSVLAGVEKALLGGVGNANVRGLLAFAWAPRSHDRDGDGIDDDVDRCPDRAEDFDGFQDADGCPEMDNDGDGIPDQLDKCPNEPEDVDGFEDGDGCPDRDDDEDGIPDQLDACPRVPGEKSADPKKNGCPSKDRDGDGIDDDKDKCPDEPEDLDGFQDADGCPDPDNDGDGVPDKEDACPDVPGARSTNPKENGCPGLDPDRDTFVGSEDKCPNEPEDFNGFEDADGCPDGDKKGARNAAPLVVVRQPQAGPVIRVDAKVAIKDGALDPASLPAVRALAVELMRHPTWTVLVGVRPKPNADESTAKKAAADIVAKLGQLARRNEAARAVEWKDVRGAPRAEEFGVGFVVVVEKPTAKVAEEPKPAENK